jgi:hypothetical protein
MPRKPEEDLTSTTYRVIDLRNAAEPPAEIRVTGAKTPEDAALRALGLQLVRSGRKAALVARVYWKNGDQPTNMVRLYCKSES